MRDYGPGHPLVFSHIPKTAGTSLTAALVESLAPPVFVTGLDMSLVGGYEDFARVRAAERSTFFFEPEALPADASLVAGHISPGTTMARYPGAEHITFLRNPQVRLISQWLHSRSLSDFDIRHWGPSADAFRVARQPLRDYLLDPKTAPNTDNTITRFLVFPHDLLEKDAFIDESQDEALLAAAIERIDACAHVDVVENPAFMARLGEWLGRDLPQTRLNERTSMPPKMRPDLEAELDEATRAKLDHRCRIDNQVWAYVARRTLPDADPADTLTESFAKSVDRYAAALDDPGQARPVKRAVESVYGMGARFRRRSNL